MFSEKVITDGLTKRGLNKRYHSASLKDFKSEFPTDKSLFITGGVGSGKTHLVAALMRNDIETSGKGVYHKAKFTSMISLLSRIKNSFAQNAGSETEAEIIKELFEIENLYIDDIGVDKVTDWNLVVLFQIVDYRYSNNMRTVFTSNLDLNLLNDRLGERVASRIAEMCEVIIFSGKDRRVK